MMTKVNINKRIKQQQFNTSDNNSTNIMNSATKIIGLLFIGVVIITIALSPTAKQQIMLKTKQQEQQNNLMSSKNNINDTDNNDFIHTGEILNIPFYYCTNNRDVDSNNFKDVVLLHGAAFTKEDWKTSGILQLLCDDGGSNATPAVRVIAFDLSIQAKKDELLALFDELYHLEMMKKPIDALITPSASGSTIIDWFLSIIEQNNNNDSNHHHHDISEQLQEYVKVWIPVACNGLLKIEPIDVIEQIKNWEIMAIYGNLDTTGQRSSELLSTKANAKMIELQGRHPVYLDSPKEFVQIIKDAIHL